MGSPIRIIDSACAHVFVPSDYEGPFTVCIFIHINSVMVQSLRVPSPRRMSKINKRITPCPITSLGVLNRRVYILYPGKIASRETEIHFIAPLVEGVPGQWQMARESEI